MCLGVTVMGVQSDMAVLVIIFGLLTLIAGAGTVFGAIAAAVVLLRTAGQAKFLVKPDEIVPCRGQRPLEERAMALSDVSGIFVRYSSKYEGPAVATTHVGVGPVGAATANLQNSAQGAGQAIAQMFTAISAVNSAMVMVNHKGKKRVLARRLSDDEADHLLSAIGRVI